jgi:hypothetical protein
VYAELYGSDASGTHGHRKCLEWNAGLVNAGRRLLYCHCRVTDYIVSQHVDVIAPGGALETGVASDMFAEAEQATHDTFNSPPRNMHAVQGVYAEVLAHGQPACIWDVHTVCKTDYHSVS